MAISARRMSLSSLMVGLAPEHLGVTVKTRRDLKLKVLKEILNLIF